MKYSILIAFSAMALVVTTMAMAAQQEPGAGVAIDPNTGEVLAVVEGSEGELKALEKAAGEHFSGISGEEKVTVITPEGTIQYTPDAATGTATIVGVPN